MGSMGGMGGMDENEMSSNNEENYTGKIEDGLFIYTAKLRALTETRSA